MILQMLAHIRCVMHHVNAESSQTLTVPDPGHLQQLRRGNSTAGQNHVSTLDGLFAAVPADLDPCGQLAIEQDTLGDRVGNDGEIGA